MENQKEEKHNHQGEDCPLCETSKEAIDKLNLPERLNTEKEINRNKSKSTRKYRIAFMSLVIILGAYAIYSSLASTLQPLSKENNLSQTQTESSDSEAKNSFLNTTTAPDFYASDIYGNKFILSDFRNKKPVLLVFWATWCGFCLKELPNLKVFTEENKNDIKVLVVVSGEDKDPVEEYIEEHNVNFTMLLDNTRDIWNLYKVRGTPAHFLIAKDGEIITIRPGLATMEDLETMLSML